MIGRRANLLTHSPARMAGPAARIGAATPIYTSQRGAVLRGRPARGRVSVVYRDLYPGNDFLSNLEYFRQSFPKPHRRVSLPLELLP